MTRFELPTLPTENVHLPAGCGIEDQPAVKAILAAGNFAGLGKVLFAGLTYDGQANVVFEPAAGTGTYSSIWPAWAYDLAKQALLADKRLYVGASDPAPFGNYLLYVWIWS
jgi:hypothetical protein